MFDKQAWESAGDRWDLPLRLVPPDPVRGDGTAVTLSRLRRRFDEVEVERRIIDSVPLSAPGFAVFLNGRRIMPLRLPGHRIPVLEGTAFGTVHGEIVIVPIHLASATDLGIDIKVRQVTVHRDQFGIEGRDATRIKGEVHADFLPVTADRTGFVRDSDEYRAFLQVMERVVAAVRATLGHLSDRTERQKSRQAVREAFRRIQRALARNPELSPFGAAAYAQPSQVPGGGGGVLSEEGAASKLAGSAEDHHAATRTLSESKLAGVAPVVRPPKKRRPRVRRLTPDALVQRVKLGEAGVACCLDHFGPDGREAFSEGTTIYINRDHPLYLRNSRRRETHTLHVARLLTQEISMMKDPRSPRQAFERQSKLLRDAFSDD